MSASSSQNNLSNTHNGNAVQNKQSVVVPLISRYNQQIEDMYSSLVVNPLENMKSSEKQGQFDFVIFGSEKQDDLETFKKINISDIKKKDPEIANKILQFARESQQQRKGTDYEFLIKEDEKGNIEIPYIAVIDIVERAVEELPKQEAVSFLKNVKDSLNKKKAEEQSESKRRGWISFGIGLLTSAMTLTGLVLPNVISSMSETLAKSLKIVGFVGLGLTVVLVVAGVIAKFAKAMKKNNIDVQRDTIDELLGKAKTKSNEIRLKHNQELTNATTNIAKTTATKAVGGALMNLQEAQRAKQEQEHPVLANTTGTNSRGAIITKVVPPDTGQSILQSITTNNFNHMNQNPSYVGNFNNLNNKNVRQSTTLNVNNVMAYGRGNDRQIGNNNYINDNSKQMEEEAKYQMLMNKVNRDSANISSMAFGEDKQDKNKANEANSKPKGGNGDITEDDIGSEDTNYQTENSEEENEKGDDNEQINDNLSGIAKLKNDIRVKEESEAKMQKNLAMQNINQFQNTGLAVGNKYGLQQKRIGKVVNSNLINANAPQQNEIIDN